MMVRPVYTLIVISSILASIFTYTVKAHALEVPVLVQSASGSRVLILLDDSHSMWNVIEHPDYLEFLKTTCKSQETHPRCLIPGSNPAKYRSLSNYFHSKTNGAGIDDPWNEGQWTNKSVGLKPFEGGMGLPHHIWRIRSGTGTPSLSSPVELALVLENDIAKTPHTSIPNEVNIDRDGDNIREFTSSLTLGTVGNSSLLQRFTCGERFECFHNNVSLGNTGIGIAHGAWAVGRGGDQYLFGHWAHRLGYNPWDPRLVGKDPSEYITLSPTYYPQHALQSLSVGATTLADRRNTLMKYTDPYIVGANLFSPERLHRESDLLTIRNYSHPIWTNPYNPPKQILPWTFPQPDSSGSYYQDSAGNEFQYTFWRHYRLPDITCPYSGNEGGEASGNSGAGGDNFNPGGGGGGGGGGGWQCQPNNNNWYWPIHDQGWYHSLGGEINFMGKRFNLPRGRYEPDYLFWVLYIATEAQLNGTTTEPIKEPLPKNRWDIALEIIQTVIENNTNIEFSFDTFNRWRRPDDLNAPFAEVVFNNGPRDTNPLLPNQVVAPFGTNTDKDAARATLLAQIKKALPFGQTPMGKGFLNAANYLVDGVGGPNESPAPMSNSCASYSIIMISDGLPEGEFNTTMSWKGASITNVDNDNNNGNEKGQNSANCQNKDCGYWADDLAYILKNTDLRPDLEGSQTIRTGVIGFGLADQLLDKMASNGGTGSAYLAKDAESLATSLDELLSQVIVSPASGSAVMISESLEDSTLVYRPRFQADKWTGNIDIFTVNQQGNLTYSDDLALGYKNLQPNSRTVVAGKPWGNNEIMTKDIDFTPSNANKLKASLFAKFDTQEEPLPATLLEEPIRDKSTLAAEKLINYIRGQKIDGLRSRDRDGTNKPNADLGDIVYSPIAEVGPRNGNYLALTGYADYVKSKNNSERVLLVGANDGMLHAFGKTSKVEKWSFIPGSIVSNLHYLSRLDYASSFRRSYVDGKITIHDIHLNGSWRTIAVVGLRTGGTSYSVLDVTNRTERPTVLFEVNDPDQQLGESWIKPEIIATVGNGNRNSSNPSDYSWHLVVGSSEGRTQAGTKLAVYPIQDNGATPSPTFLTLNPNATEDTRIGDILAVQSDRDMAVDRLYVGSEDGNFYRVEVNGPAPGAWTVVKLLSLGVDAPITTKATAVLVENPNRSFDGIPTAVGVYFGTGRFDRSDDIRLIRGSVQQYIVGLFDPVKLASDDYDKALSTLTLSNLKNQTGTSFSSKLNVSTGLYEVEAGKRGFYHQLVTVSTPENGFIPPVGMVTRNPINRDGVILFPTFLPESVSQNNCTFGGESFIVGIEMRTGGGAAADYGLPNGKTKYNGGIRDFDQNSSITEADIDVGYTSKLLQPVLDALQPQNNQLTKEDFNTKQVSSAGIALRSNVVRLSSGGMPLEASLLTGAGRLIVQTSLIGTPSIGEPEPPQDDTVPSPGTPIDGANLPKPNQAPINLLKHPARFLTYHQVTNEGP